MAQPNVNLQKWLSAAVGGIRFKPDRAAVEQELREHIEDKTADLMRIFPGMTGAEAEERALSGMGDPKELGKELAKIHKPWLGYLWRASQALLGAAALAALFFVILQPSFFNQLENNDQADWYDHRYYGIQPHEWAPPPAVEVGDYTLEVTRAARWEENWSSPEGEIVQRWESGVFTLRVTAPWPWERPPAANQGLEYNFTATDSGGKVFSFRNDPLADFFEQDEQPMQQGAAGLLWREYEMYCPDITPGAEWLLLEYDFGGRAFTIRVELPQDIHYYRGRGVALDIRGEETP